MWAVLGEADSMNHGGAAVTVDVWVETGRGCNLSCGFCYNAFQERQPLAPQIRKVRISDRLRLVLERVAYKCRLGRVTLAGGELFLQREWPAIVQAACEAAVDCALVSNGTLCAPGYGKVLSQSGVSLIQFSIHGATEAVHDRIVGRGGSLRALLRAAVEARQERLNVGFSYVYCGQPAEDVDGVVEWASAVDAGYLVLNRVREAEAEACNGESRDAEDTAYQRVLERALEHSDRLGVSLLVTGFVPEVLRSRLRLHLSGEGEAKRNPRLNVDLQGNLRACLTSAAFRANVWDDNWFEAVRELVDGTGSPSLEECDCRREAARRRKVGID
jgi:MoaA/NifB/PqqE/SkfB family radical SAM enzyme